MLNILDSILSIANSLFSIIMLMLPFVMMKNYNLIIMPIEDSRRIVISKKGITICLENYQSS
ncbi:MAG: hypothetical protein M5T52_24140 [Ignavibacteriaceae bacterium]|nr:hypothetical protein [Ignavibacteriaceae bacterium]